MSVSFELFPFVMVCGYTKSLLVNIDLMKQLNTDKVYFDQISMSSYWSPMENFILFE